MISLGYVLVVTYLLIFVTSELVTVSTMQGQVIGKTDHLGDLGDVTKFLGIPFAEPPIGRLRFEAPREVLNFTYIHDATYGRPQCPQTKEYLSLFNFSSDSDVNFRTDEDCLYLNVYIPGLVVRRGQNLPVMVYIHGGSWMCGSGTHYDARKLAVKGRVIVITLNYRLGVLGFLPIPGSSASTLGLQDQIEALKWVKRNIQSYGGNPNLVTIFGQSAGGASVSYLCSSPAAKGLFHRAISQSGLKTSSWASLDQSAQLATREALSEAVKDNCSESFVDCLRNLPVSQLTRLTASIAFHLGSGQCAWQPGADGHVVMPDVQENHKLVQPRLDIIIGITTDEGGTVIEVMCPKNSPCRTPQGIPYSTINKFVAPQLNSTTVKRIGKKYIEWYPIFRQGKRMSLRAASAFTSDWFERLPTNRTATALREAGHKVYFYEFNAKPKRFISRFIDVPWSDDAQHGDELPYIFAAVKDPDDINISDQMIRLWTNFAKGEDLQSSWPQFGPEANYLYISHNGFTVKRPLLEQRKQDFWQPWFSDGKFPVEEKSNQASRHHLSFATIVPIILMDVNQLRNIFVYSIF